MKTILSLAILFLTTLPALAWNGAGHRLVAAVAWRQMSPEAQRSVGERLRLHPDFPRWTAKAETQTEYAAFLRASTWPDDIRSDSRYYDEKNDPPTRIFPGMADTARHKPWHYVDQLPDGSREGDLDHQLEHMIRRLSNRSTPFPEITYALPWIIHLLGDIHQPLHVGNRDDKGGNRFEIEDPFNPRLPFTNLHTWWDDLPGPPWLKGARLEKVADALLAAHPKPPRQGNVALWERESREIGQEHAYPKAVGSLLPTITEDFRARSRAIANRRLVEAGYRLGRLLEGNFGTGSKVPRETE